MRKRAKVDRNHGEVVAALVKAGWQVISLAAVGDGVPDLLCFRHDKGVKLIEVKGPKGKLTPDQKERFARGWPITIIRSVDDALHL